MFINTNRLLITGWLLVITATLAHAQPNITQVRVPIDLLKKHVYLLASDSLQGRKTGTQGQREAAIYCSRAFRQSQLTPLFRLDSANVSFRQTYPFTMTEVRPFGQLTSGRNNVNNGGPTTITRYELTDLPVSKRDSASGLFGQNVAGLLVGGDLKQKVVIISAHYDHLGQINGQVFPGADDNASGTASVLSIAATFDSLARQGIRPRRSVLFLLFSGEEGGLIGSQYFVTHCPLLNDQIVCDLNVDMVGRVDPGHRKKPDYCYIIAGRQDTHLLKAVDQANRA